MNNQPRLCLIGLDCASPELVFDRWRDDLPNLSKLMETGGWGELESITPPITVPAWMCMMTGRDPGELGIYGFRNRADRGYESQVLANSGMISKESIWEELGRYGFQSIVLGVPLTYPPKPINGLLASDFMMPGIDSEYTYPPELKSYISDAVGTYVPDVRDFRTSDKTRLLRDITEMTKTRFQLAMHLATEHPWDFFAMVEMGTDRIHHGFWSTIDADHPKYDPGSPFANAIHDYYVMVDSLIGELVASLPDETSVLIVSDHGAKSMLGAFCFNDWLIQEGYLVLHETPDHPCKLTPEMVNWGRTRAWGDGGYYGRLWINLEGRESSGIVNPQEIDTMLSELERKLSKITVETGRTWKNQFHLPKSIYREVTGVAPDAIIYFDDLSIRSHGTVGNGSLFARENDTGPDDANHAERGILISGDPNLAGRGRQQGLRLLDVSGLIRNYFGLGHNEPPIGRSKLYGGPDSVYSVNEEAEIARRLEDLGYL